MSRLKNKTTIMKIISPLLVFILLIFLIYHLKADNAIISAFDAFGLATWIIITMIVFSDKE